MSIRAGVSVAVLSLIALQAADAEADVLEQAKAAAVEFGMQAAREDRPRQRSFERTMTGLALAVVGGRLVWYRFEDKDCREPEGARCDWIAGAGLARLVAGGLLMTVLGRVPAAPSIGFEPRPGGAAVRAAVAF